MAKITGLPVRKTWWPFFILHRCTLDLSPNGCFVLKELLITSSNPGWWPLLQHLCSANFPSPLCTSRICSWLPQTLAKSASPLLAPALLGAPWRISSASGDTSRFWWSAATTWPLVPLARREASLRRLGMTSTYHNPEYRALAVRTHTSNVAIVMFWSFSPTLFSTALP